MSGPAPDQIAAGACKSIMPDQGKGPRGRGGRAQTAAVPFGPVPPDGSARGSKKRQRLVLTGAAPVFPVEAALQEITTTPAATLHREAAHAWAARALACYRVCLGKVDLQEGLSYLYLGEHYREAALAHAAMGEAWQPLFAEIDEAMAKDRQLAFASMRGRSPVATR